MRLLRVSCTVDEPAARWWESALVARGVEVTLVRPDRRSLRRAGASAAAASLGPLGYQPFGVEEAAVRDADDELRHRLARPSRIPDLLRVARPDVVDLHAEPGSALVGQWLEALGDVPLVLHTRQNTVVRLPRRARRIQARALERVAAVFPGSRQAAAVVAHHGYAGPVEVVPAGVDPGVFRPGGQRAPRPGADGVVLGVVGPLDGRHGVLDAVQVLAELRDLPARLLVVDDGADPDGDRAFAGGRPTVELAGLRSAASALGVTHRLELVSAPTAAERAAQLARVNILLVPRRRTREWAEPVGRCVTEGQAAGAVVVGYDTGVVGEAIGPGGVVVADGDVAGMVEEVRGLVRDPFRWNRLRELGRIRAAERSYEALAVRQIELYRAAARLGGRGGGVGGGAGAGGRGGGSGEAVVTANGGSLVPSGQVISGAGSVRNGHSAL